MELLDIIVKDMNDLIVRFDELSENIIKNISDQKDKALKNGEFTILAPVPVPMQDVICLGVNYKSHIEETVDVLDFILQQEHLEELEWA